VALRFVSMSTAFYLIVSIQGSIQAQMAVNQAAWAQMGYSRRFVRTLG
jgi:cbb3-type cytochrome oxidase subunit 1